MQILEMRLEQTVITPERPKRVFISGVRGFIGHHLALHLQKLGYQVLGIDNLSHPCGAKLPKGIFHWGDVRYFKDLSSFIANADLVFHLAAQINVDKSIQNPQETIDTNVTGTLNVLDACRKWRKPVVIASTSEVYGSARSPLMAEDHPLDAQSPYGASKVAADRLAYSYYKTYDLPVKILRNFNTSGSFQSFDAYGGVIAKFTHQATHNMPLSIFGDGTQQRDYMDVQDAVAAYLAVAQYGVPGEAYNAGGGSSISVNRIAEIILEETGSKSPVVHVEPRLGEVERLTCDNTKIKSLGWEPKYSPEDVVRNYVRWYKAEFKK